MRSVFIKEGKKMKIKVFIIFVLMVILIGTQSLCAFIVTRTVKPIKSLEDIVLTKPLYDFVGTLDKGQQRLVYTAYIAGFLDAAQLEEANVLEMKDFLKKCEGMNLGGLSDVMMKFYEDNPQWRDQKPANILIKITPRLREGLPPLTPEELQKY